MVEELPNNTSPDTIQDDDGDDSPVTVGEIADSIVERLKGLLPGAGGSGGEPSEGGSSGTPAGTATPPPEPTGTVAAQGGTAVESVEAVVRRVMDQRDMDGRVAAVEEQVSKPPEPKPNRVGIGAFLFGKERR